MVYSSMLKNARLRDEWGCGTVSAWPLLSPLQLRTLPEGTLATVVGPSLNGYVVIFVGDEAFEVWHENLSLRNSIN